MGKFFDDVGFLGDTEAVMRILEAPGHGGGRCHTEVLGQSDVTSSMCPQHSPTDLPMTVARDLYDLEASPFLCAHDCLALFDHQGNVHT